MTDPIDKKAILHKIRNALSPLRTFLKLVDTSREDPQLQTFHESCKANLVKVLDLLQKLE